MEEIRVTDVVRANKRNVRVFGPFMSEHIVLQDGRLGETLRQFLADERLQGRYPIMGNGPLYRPVEEGAVVVAPRTWGVTTPDELTGALVGVDVVGTIPVDEYDSSAGEILVVRLTEPDGIAPADFVRSGPAIRTETDVCLGWDVWVDCPTGIPSAFSAAPFPTPEEAEKAEEEDPDNYW